MVPIEKCFLKVCGLSSLSQDSLHLTPNLENEAGEEPDSDKLESPENEENSEEEGVGINESTEAELGGLHVGQGSDPEERAPQQPTG